MRRARWLAPWRNSPHKPAIYHCISRVVDRRFVLGPGEKEKFRALMRMMEKFSGCRVLSYCLMSNHIHLLLEVPPMPPGGISDEQLLERLRAIYSGAFVAEVAGALAAAREPGVVDKDAAVAEVHRRFTYRMHDLGEFMKTLLQRFTQWFNRAHSRTGRLWEDRYKSVIVQDGVAARTMAAYIDLNPVRAGIVKAPEDYRWSGYGEAMGGGTKGNGKTARAGLVRAWGAHLGVPADAARWAEFSRGYRGLLMGKIPGAGAGETRAEGVSFGKMLRCRIRYFTDGAVIGSRAFVDEAFERSRTRFGPKRKSGARRLRGEASPARDALWSMRDLRKGIG